SKRMTKSGLYKTSEKLEVIPKQYYIVRHKRVIYNCNSCHGSMYNAPMLPSIIPSSNYGDSVIIDIALSKYCDLIPIERYSSIAARSGIEGLPPNSLIGLTHSLAQFLQPVYEQIKEEVLSSELVMMDETPHKMLEGDITANWYLWGFATQTACVFEAHGTRSGDIPLSFLLESRTRYLLTDGYSGYKKAIGQLAKQDKEVEEIYCNAHAYRYFKDAAKTWEEETEVFRKLYGEIYELERNAETEEQKIDARSQMEPLFIDLKNRCELAKEATMPGSAHEKAVNYFLNHFDGLSKCVGNIKLPLDNNFSERLLRSPVIGRKTWYGTHSKRGARTSSVLFSIVESCKINSINPRNYFSWVVERSHKNQDLVTPFQYASLIDSG
ncbi:IS66 family transposase, partial [Pseudobacteriovorax antillogorgiicola]